MNTTLTIKRYQPRPGENSALRWQLCGFIETQWIMLPFASKGDAVAFCQERKWQAVIWD